jgi:two-component system, NtrC family, response regulator AtoC
MADDNFYEESARTRPIDEEELEAQPKGISLLIVHGLGGRLVQLDPDSSIILGRSVPADILVKDSSLSREHARIQIRKGRVWVEDLQSTNGTRFEGKRIESGYLLPGTHAMMGRVRVSVHHTNPEEATDSKLLAHDLFRATVATELIRAREHDRSLAVLHLRAFAKERPEIANWYGSLIAHLGPLDRVAIYSNEAAEILLPESNASHARDFAEKLARSSDLTAVGLRCGIAIFPHSGTSGEELVEASRKALAKTSSPASIQMAPILHTQSLQEDPSAEQPVAFSAAMKEVLSTAARLAGATIPVLVEGETGTGKEVVARAIHHGGPRAANKLCSVNCGAIPRDLVESVLLDIRKALSPEPTEIRRGSFSRPMAERSSWTKSANFL